MRSDFLIAKVAVSAAAYSFDSEYSYSVPEALRSRIKPGMRVIVPFGNGNRRIIGLVTRLKTIPEPDDAVKPLMQLADEEPLINEEMLRLIFWLKENTFCTYFDAFRSIVPSGFGYKFSSRYVPANVPVNESELSEQELRVLSFMRQACSQKEIDEFLDLSAQPKLKGILASLIDKGYVEQEDQLKRRVGDESVKMLRLSDEYLSSAGTKTEPKLTPKQKSIVDLLTECGCAAAKEVRYMTSCTDAILTRMKKNKVITEFENTVLRDAIGEITEQLPPESIELNDEQTNAYEGIMSLINEGKPAGSLLYGVTGSGKTAVFFRIIDSVLKLGKTALMLVPEISLTPQMLRRFKKYFGNRIAVLHSSLSLGQRNDEFKRIRSGDARIVIGTRSAVFAPLSDIGVIIIDEEGEHTYKSESSPRYHARDVAIQRCGYHNAVLVMASATPSLETFYYAKKGRFHLFELRKRYADAVLPEVEIIDMAYEGGKLFSTRLREKLREALDKKEQAILLLNRRGFHTYISCLECRKPVSCPNCALPLTYHKKNNKLMCHYCGFSMDNVSVCPECGSDRLYNSGVGTQRVEDELAAEFPDARVLRMDADTTFSRYSYEQGFNDFEKGKYDIMLGTQMIAKGLNFPNVTLVGVVSLDKALFTGDFRSYERTFSLLTQVAGRSGRGDKPGSACLQTFVPDHFVLNLAAKQDYDEFYSEEIALRQSLIYPPFCDICVIGFSAAMESKAIEASDWFARELGVYINSYVIPNKIKMFIRAIGPAPCTLGRINNKYRYRLILKCRNDAEFRKMISSVLLRFYKITEFRQVSIYADINGDIGL
ncbi:MAG: primosomal protein N' [Ruminococcus sp.]|nr:primosomal protein N' [Ruminococcus sp.]